MTARIVWTSLIMVALVTGLVAGASNAQEGGEGASAVLTAFTYQGRLEDASGPVDGTCDFTFKLYNAASGGTLLGTQPRSDVEVAGGRFTVRLDFGAGAFDGGPRWLQVEVDCGAGSKTLSPRQELTAAPYALWAFDGPFWALTGNGGTAPGANFLGTTDDQALELHVNGERALRLEPARDGDTVVPNVIGGFALNSVTDGVVGATISGGGQASGCAEESDPCPNQVRGDYGTVGGGSFNTAWERYATISGGHFNIARSRDATVSGGYMNWAVSEESTVGGGAANEAEGEGATVAGGTDNWTSGDWATVSGGHNNKASAQHATVGGGLSNEAAGGFATVGGGNEHSASGAYASVAGGQKNAASGDYATVAGGQKNTASDDYATVAGGQENTASGIWATIGGGDRHTASGAYATVGGGVYNRATENSATVGGGHHNTATASGATVAGGADNHAEGSSATVGGGVYNHAGRSATVGGGVANLATGEDSAIPGGYYNEAQGIGSFAAGSQAKANQDGCFVWGDATYADITCSDENRTIFRATGGFYIYTSDDLSTGAYLGPGENWWDSIAPHAQQENFQPLDTQNLLEDLAGLEFGTWAYDTQDPSIRHVGPMAQDLNTLLPDLGSERAEHLNARDASGLALAAIQGLYARNQVLEGQVADLEARLAALEALLGAQTGSEAGGAP